MKAKITKQEVVERVKEADNILIITSGSPRIDQLSACLGLIGILQDLDKNAIFVHSGETTEVIDFLEPDKVIQKDAESLRDFIISFNQSKVDKFRYNQEGNQYNILLTPAQREVITKDDIEFRKGDFNIDLVLALGIESKSNIDPSVSKHSQLIEEIPMVNIVAGKKGSSLEAPYWQEDSASSLGEAIYELSQSLEMKKLPRPVANALLTGIVDQTERYRTKRTKSQTMHVSAELLEMGGDLQLVADNLARAGSVPVSIPEAETKAMVEEALGEAGEYDTKVIKKKATQTAESGRARMRHGDVGKGLSYGEKVKQLEAEGTGEHKLDRLNIDAEGNLRVLSEEEQATPAPAVAAQQAESPPVAAAQMPSPAMVSATDQAQSEDTSSVAAAPAPAVANGGRNILTPSSNIKAPVHPALAGGDVSPQAAPSLAELNVAASPAAPVAPMAPAASMAERQAPSISEIVDRTADPVAPVAPVAPNLNEKVAALAPTNPNTDSYIDSLMTPDGKNPVPPPIPDANSGQALTVDSYLAQQQPAGAPAQAPPVQQPNPYAPPSAPPLASMT